MRRLLPSLLVAGVGLAAAGDFDDHVFVLTTDGTTGSSAAVGIVAPWPAAVGLEPTGRDAVVRHFFGRHYVVDREAATVQVIDPATFDTLLQFSVGPGTRPEDIAVVDRRTAWVSRQDSCRLYRVDPTTGVGAEATDLCAFADADGLPEMGTLALDGRHLFVQLRRIDRLKWVLVPPSYLAVVDAVTGELVDADPSMPGVQAITLAGTNPSHEMQLDRAARRLWVSTPGAWLDQAGGIEIVDLDGLRSLGFLTTETQLQGADLSRFVLVSPDKGYAVVHTDLVLTSHLTAFSRLDGSSLGEVHMTGGLVLGLEFDPPTSQLFIAEPGEGAAGLQVLDTLTDTLLNPAPIPTGQPPGDLAIARRVTPGEATELRVTAVDPATGALWAGALAVG